jgi:hypothetical protein
MNISVNANLSSRSGRVSRTGKLSNPVEPEVTELSLAPGGESDIGS